MTPTNRCLDSETLAAWVDGGLSRNDAAMAEAHVSSCPRCQEIAGLIVKTTPPTTVAAPWWGARAAWLVPATAGVAAVGLWILAPTSRVPSPIPPPAPSERQRVEGPPATATLETAGNAATPAAPPVAPPADAKAADTKVTQTKAQAKEVEAKQERKRDDRANNALADAAAAAAAPPAANAPAAAALGRRAEERLAQKSAAPAGAKAAVSPDGTLHWRITDAGALERSTDGGTTWQAVNVGITATFTTVQAPEPRVALVTTTDGRVFRTSDGGTTWQLVAPKL